MSLGKKVTLNTGYEIPYVLQPSMSSENFESDARAASWDSVPGSLPLVRSVRLSTKP